MSNLQAVNDSNFEDQVLQSELPVLVDFWAPWCGPCKAIAPILEEISTDYDTRLLILKCNVDENTMIPTRYGIRGIPTLLLFKQGKVIMTNVGAVTKSKLIELIDAHI